MKKTFSTRRAAGVRPSIDAARRRLGVAAAASIATLGALPLGVLPFAARSAESAESAAAVRPRVRFETSLGAFVVELQPDRAPKSCANFLDYAKSGFYDGTVFHRVIKEFMIQGGGFTTNMVQKPTRPPIAIESNNGLKNVRGALAMARTGDPNSATAQFFVNVVDNPFLDYPGRDGFGYAVFGSVVEGMDVVDRIRDVETASFGPFRDVPKAPVVIKSARILK